MRRAVLWKSSRRACQTGGHRREIRRGAVTDHMPQGRGVEVVRDEIAEQVELSGALGGERRVGRAPEPGAARLLRDADQQRAPEPVVLEQPVPVRAEDGARVRSLAIQEQWV